MWRWNFATFTRRIDIDTFHISMLTDALVLWHYVDFAVFYSFDRRRCWQRSCGGHCATGTHVVL